LFLAEHDSLTGIPNRKHLKVRRETHWRGPAAIKAMLRLCLIDVDRFKDINDSFGHGAGDEVLRTFAMRLKSSIREGGYGGAAGRDEFVVLQVGMAQPSGLHIWRTV